MNKTEKKPVFPRTEVVDRQKERARKLLDLDKESLETVRGGAARYGLPPTELELCFPTGK
ncbi:hypothetical protein [Archangium lipolyticum]|uniref:hypothetical protein n=1 Tax=Archangium lipolyticum TaxID=2970465 RepID=UPI00214A1587|nr:hypothetical protein [Archangium lipolyticum]